MSGFWAGRVRFEVRDCGVNMLNRLKGFNLFDICPLGDGDSFGFSVPLSARSAVGGLLGKREFRAVQNGNALRFLNYFYTRAFLVLALVAVAVGFCFSERYAFRVRVEGLTVERQAAVTEFLSNRGIGGITPKRAARDEQLLVEMVRHFDFLAAACVSTRGSAMIFSFQCADNVTASIPNSEIVAAVDGVIRDIIVFSGLAAVTKGDVVRIGDVLVTGTRPTAIVVIANGNKTICVLNNTIVK